MGNAVCWQCVEDEYLQKIIKAEGELIECSVCGEDDQNAFTVEQLGELLEPILREHFELGQEVKRFGEDDKEWWEQEGDPLSWAVQTVLGQYFDFEDDIVDAVVDAEDVWPGDGDVSFFDTSCNYVESRVVLSHYYAEWNYLLTELKHSRRFFSPSAQALFGKLFEDVETLRAWNDETKGFESVIRELPEGTEVFRSRICNSRSTLTEIYKDPLKHVGPPPKEHARAGRMNAEGVVVLYGAMDAETCLAEMRPPLGGESVIISLRTTRQLRLLDFSRLERARGGKSLSYFQPDFKEQVEKRAFLRRLHGLISQPITPGKEADYLITRRWLSIQRTCISSHSTAFSLRPCNARVGPMSCCSQTHIA
jgi:hypothetical protein